MNQHSFDKRMVLATPSGYMVYDDGDIVSVHECHHPSFDHFWDLQAHFHRVTKETRHRQKVRKALSEAAGRS